VSVAAFALGRTPVTNEQFLVFLRETGYQPPPCNPTLELGWRSPGRGHAYPPGTTDPPLWPAACLSWDDAQAYIAWLDDRVRGLASAAHARGGPYRLPSEAEWEYAARAGSTTLRWWGDEIGQGRANCNGCGSAWDARILAPVGSFGPNPFGLYDMLGNVWQWVDDCWNESYVGAPQDGSSWQRGDCSKRVMRGGSWINVPAFVRSAVRSKADEDGVDFDYSIYAGFRVARSLP
jgi:formylglycine-generating enzyme required for sulfatase activity